MQAIIPDILPEEELAPERFLKELENRPRSVSCSSDEGVQLEPRMRDARQSSDSELELDSEEDFMKRPEEKEKQAKIRSCDRFLRQFFKEMSLEKLQDGKLIDNSQNRLPDTRKISCHFLILFHRTQC